MVTVTAGSAVTQHHAADVRYSVEPERMHRSTVKFQHALLGAEARTVQRPPSCLDVRKTLFKQLTPVAYLTRVSKGDTSEGS